MKQTINALTSNRFIAMIVLALLAVPWSMAARVPGWQWAWAVVSVCVTAFIGLLLRRTWAFPFAAAALALYVIHSAFLLASRGWKTSRALQALCVGVLAWGVWRKPHEGILDEKVDEPDDDDDTETLISLVHLRATKRYLEPAILAQALSDAWNVKLQAHSTQTPPTASEMEDYTDGFVADTGPTYIVFMTKPFTAFFIVHNHDGNYFSNPESLADKVPNLRFAEVIRTHEAWLSIDLLDKASSPETLAQAYQLIGKAVSALADDQTLALFCPQHSFINLWNESLEEQLCGPEPLKVFQQEVKAPIFGVGDDSGIEQAIAEARERWPEFAKAFRNRKREDPPFIVKAPFTTEGKTEHIWLEVFGIEPEYVHGHLLNDPFYHPSLKSGSQVEVPVAEISDWVFAEDGKPVGNFTAQAINRSRTATRNQS